MKLFLILLFGLFTFSGAEAKHSGYTCEQIRAAVASIGVQELIRQARAQGATRAQIAAGKRCLSQG